jgi:predicted acyltransferase
MNDTAPLVLFIAGVVLFVLGDILWLIRNTFSRPMNLRLSGGMVGVGIALISIGLGWFALTAGGG